MRRGEKSEKGNGKMVEMRNSEETKVGKALYLVRFEGRRPQRRKRSNTERKRGELTGPMFQFSGDDLYFLLPPGGEGRNRRRKGKRRSGGGKKKQALGFA